MIETIVFDIDGTLYNETDLKAVAELKVARYLSDFSPYDAEEIYSKYRTVKDEYIKEHKGSPAANDRTKWFEILFKEMRIEKLDPKEATDFYWENIYTRMNPFEDVVDVLPELQKRFDLYLMTDESEEVYKNKIKSLKLDGFFSRGFTAEEVGVTKPNIRFFEYVISKINKDKEKILIIGDNPSADIRGGNAAGIRTAWLKRGKYNYYSLKDGDMPDIKISNYIQLIKKIEKL